MLAMRSYEQNEGFSVMTADELYFINGGSGSGNQTACAVATFGCAVGAVLCPEAAAGLAIVGAGIALAGYLDSQEN
jgi:hypothetical protein